MSLAAQLRRCVGSGDVADSESGKKRGGRPRKYPVGSRPLWLRLSPELLRGLGGQCATNEELRAAVEHAVRAFCGLA